MCIQFLKALYKRLAKIGTMPEIWDLYDKENNLTGQTIQRGKWMPKNRYHRVVEGWIRTSDGKFLLQQRAKSKKSYPNYWSCSAIGSVLAGESPEDAMIREMEEEIGVKIQKEDLVLDRIITSYPAHFYIYKIEKDVKPEEIKLDPKEVQSYAFVTLEELREWIRQRKLTKLAYYQDFLKNWK